MLNSQFVAVNISIDNRYSVMKLSHKNWGSFCCIKKHGFCVLTGEQMFDIMIFVMLSRFASLSQKLNIGVNIYISADICPLTLR